MLDGLLETSRVEPKPNHDPIADMRSTGSTDDRFVLTRLRTLVHVAAASDAAAVVVSVVVEVTVLLRWPMAVNLATCLDLPCMARCRTAVAATHSSLSLSRATALPHRVRDTSCLRIQRPDGLTALQDTCSLNTATRTLLNNSPDSSRCRSSTNKRHPCLLKLAGATRLKHLHPPQPLPLWSLLVCLVSLLNNGRFDSQRCRLRWVWKVPPIQVRVG